MCFPTATRQRAAISESWFSGGRVRSVVLRVSTCLCGSSKKALSLEHHQDPLSRRNAARNVTVVDKKLIFEADTHTNMGSSDTNINSLSY